MEIIYSDNKLIVCVKPRGVLSTDEPGGMPSLLREWLGDGEAPIYAVHRLDAPVGGLMVYARTRHTAADLEREMQAGDFEKEYRAVVHGRLRDPSGTFTDLLERDVGKRMTRIVKEPGKNVKEASLSYVVLGEGHGLTLVGIRLHTGRTHQIRCQFSGRGLPLWGDRKYGRPGDEGELALWSSALRFTHPATGEDMSFALEPPAGLPWTYFL